MVRHLGRSVLAAWAVIALELVVVAAFSHARIASVWELQFASLWLAPVALLAGTALGGAGGLALWLAARADEPWARRLLAALPALGAAAVAWGVGGGRYLATAVTRGGFALAVAALAGATAYAAGPLLARWRATRPAALALVAATLILLFELANRFVLVRLYPAFHYGLAALALLTAPWLSLAVPAPSQPPAPAAGWRRWAGPALPALIALIALAVARPAAARLAHFDNFRLLLLERAPLLGPGVRLAAQLAPPPPLASAGSGCDPMLDPGCVAPGPRGSARPLELGKRDILFISIDALRADHVGAYGYKRNTTPHIDALAKQGVLFTHAYCPTPHTSYSVTSMMTGKYMRPLLLQGAGEDSDTWASLLRTYGYRTAAFYPPAVFFIDPDRFTTFKKRHLGFEYAKVEFKEGAGRVAQVMHYIDGENGDRHLFVWVHLFAPHEPYEAHAGHDFGDRDVDRYDSEIAFADASVGQLVRGFRKRRPDTAVILTADHGEEFGDHGGHYHGTSVYEEQVHVPLVMSLPGVNTPHRVGEVVQTIDILPTVLGALDIPRPPRVRGRDLGALIAGKRASGAGLALAETDQQSLLAEGKYRLICQRRIGACRLFDLSTDPEEQHDAGHEHPERFKQMQKRLRQLNASHGRYEVRGLRAEGKDWPAPILRGVAGDGDAAGDIAGLLDDADPTLRRKAAELLFELRRPETAPALRLALGRDEDPDVKRWCALALTRLGQGAPLAYELVKSKQQRWRRLAALALAESGDRRGGATLVEWWKDKKARDYERSRQLLEALADIRDKDAVWPLVQSLDDVRLRPYIAAALAKIGDDSARGPLSRTLEHERYQSARVAITRALVQLGSGAEIARPLVHWLGVPDPLAGGLGFASQAGILENIGGPSKHALDKLRRQSELGVALMLVVPPGGNGTGVRALVRAHTDGRQTGEVHIGLPLSQVRYNSKGEAIRSHNLPRIDSSRSLSLKLPASDKPVEVAGVLPASMGARAGRAMRLVVFADHQVEVEALALVPLADELPPRAPKPWTPGRDAGAPAASDAGGQ